MHSELSEKLRQSAAKSTLNGLMIWLGEPGLAAAGTLPGLMALVDQHAAAVRDALGDPADGLSAVSLAGYAAGVRDALIEADWRVPAVAEQDWSRPEWPTVRLLAICVLARSHGYV
jgi:Family of unknown function (DUF6401)